MKKWISFFLTFAVLVLICFGSYLYFYRAEFMSTALARIYGVPVKIAKIHFSKKGMKLQDVVVYNPSQFTMQPALAATAIDIRMPVSELLCALIGCQPVEITKVTIRDPLFGIEMTNPTGSENNWSLILANIAKNADEHPSGRTFELSQVNLQDIVVEVKNRSISKGVKRPPVINRIDIGRTADDKPIGLSNIVYWVTKLSLVQIGQKLGQAEFTNSIQNAPVPQKAQESMKLLSKKELKSKE